MPSSTLEIMSAALILVLPGCSETLGIRWNCTVDQESA